MSQEIRPEEEALREFLEASDDGPFVMVNFLKFKPGGGSKAYGRYAAAFETLLLQHGGRFLYRGRVERKLVGDEDWHAIALVEYPSRQVFRQITASSEYQEIHAHREEGLDKTLLYATRSR